MTSTSLDGNHPEFTGKLYRARDDPKPDELTYNSEELENLDVVGGPVCIEHDYKMGKVGYIRASKYQHPWLFITGVIDTENKELKEGQKDPAKKEEKKEEEKK